MRTKTSISGWDIGIVFAMVSLSSQVEAHGIMRIFVNLVASIVIIFILCQIKRRENGRKN